MTDVRESFFRRKEWEELRYKILRRDDFACLLCGVRKGEGVRLHVDHIKPRSIYPELALKESNLQTLCEQCNRGKSNQYVDDFRMAAKTTEPPPRRDIPHHIAVVVSAIMKVLRAAEDAGDQEKALQIVRIYSDFGREAVKVGLTSEAAKKLCIETLEKLRAA